MQNVALLTGGMTAEREVALKSAQNVCRALEVNYHVEEFDLPADLDRFLERRAEFGVVVPVFHGRGGEDGVIQGFLESLGLPYVFSFVEAHAIGMDKATCKILARAAGLKTADWKLVEDLIEGQEFTIAVVDDGSGAVALPVIEIRSKTSFFDYEAKYDPALCEELCPAPIDDEFAERLKDVALIAHKMIGARHLSRTDMIVDQAGEIWFLEINTIPGLTTNSLTPKAITTAGLKLEDLLTVWIDDATKEKTA